MEDNNRAPAAPNSSDRDTTNRRRAGFVLPWGEVMDADQIEFWRDHLADIVDELSWLEGWSDTRRTLVLHQCRSGPLGDLIPNFHHFQELLTAARDLDDALRNRWI
ncbi:hypothetical protein [Burkholderia gladioli]|uniref:Uncharacterized protein n=1 Tax=Burkholderia gladioli (strain BSR3) TaxID=999541 RepID=F2LAT9_BURGS|nr:hypothetical protein [Burkholderia gladioli]AEA59589.1 hypothetical protein bgla_1g09040 [Burkholderia gladioli BSR3]